MSIASELLEKFNNADETITDEKLVGKFASLLTDLESAQTQFFKLGSGKKAVKFLQNVISNTQNIINKINSGTFGQ